MTIMPWLPYENDDFCIGSIQYSFCSSCGLMLTHAAHYRQQGEPLCQDCYDSLKGAPETGAKSS
ncbi:MAG: hypothetical protein NTV89_10920 [Proteobacteria bacterium]|nr:hypothetical protein [Pseudomonadota bacterium]